MTQFGLSFKDISFASCVPAHTASLSSLVIIAVLLNVLLVSVQQTWGQQDNVIVQETDVQMFIAGVIGESPSVEDGQTQTRNRRCLNGTNGFGGFGGAGGAARAQGQGWRTPGWAQNGGGQFGGQGSANSPGSGPWRQGWRQGGQFGGNQWNGGGQGQQQGSAQSPGNGGWGWGQG